MQGWKRRAVYVVLYEAIAIACSGVGMAMASGQSLGDSGGLAVVNSAIAIAWTLLFNALFERWEARQAVRGRSVARRVAHALGFEGGLIALLVPVIAWWFGVGLWQALWLDVGLVLFFLAYTFVFNWAFDRVFGLPASAIA